MISIVIHRVVIQELAPLLLFSAKTFFDAFFHRNKPEDMAAYASKFFTKEQLAAELSNPASEFYFARVNNEIVGYIKLNISAAQSDLQDNNSLEIERIYVSKYHQGKKVGKQLLDFAVQTAIARQLNYIWLGVWEHNDRAINLYRQYGFQQFGQHDFMLGNDLQIDLLMRKEI